MATLERDVEVNPVNPEHPAEPVGPEEATLAPELVLLSAVASAVACPAMPVTNSTLPDDSVESQPQFAVTSTLDLAASVESALVHLADSAA